MCSELTMDVVYMAARAGGRSFCIGELLPKRFSGISVLPIGKNDDRGRIFRPNFPDR